MIHRRIEVLRRAVLLLGAGLLVGCPGTLDDPARFLLHPDAGALPDVPVISVTDGGVSGDAAASVDVPTVRDVPVAPDVPAPCTLGTDWVTATLLPQTCGVMYCHGSSGPSAGLDLASAGVGARLVGVHGSMNCRGSLLVDPANPAASLMLVKLSATPGCGGRMPLGFDPLTPPQVVCVQRWVESLAAGTPVHGDGG